MTNTQLAQHNLNCAGWALRAERQLHQDCGFLSYLQMGQYYKMKAAAEIQHGSRVRVRSNGETGRVTFVNGDEITVVIDGYEGSNTFKRSNLEEIPNDSASRY